MEIVTLMLLVFCFIMYLLYINGIAITNMKGAIMYVESFKGKRASFDSCTGYTRRVVKFKDSRLYHFTFTSELRKGDVSAELLNADKQQILCLNRTHQSDRIEIDKTKRYYLVFRFRSATGNYYLDWD